MRAFHRIILALFATLCVAHAEPLIEKVDLFEAGKEGYALYRIPGIVVTAKGTVLAYCEARKSDKGDWGPIDVLLRRSTNGGKTWSPRQELVHLEGDLPINPVAAAQKLDKPGDNTVNNPVAIADRNGAVHFLYCLEYMRCFYMRSDDDGLTWSKPVEITATFDKFRPDYDWKVIATGPAHGIQLKNGRLVVPVWMSLGTGGHAHRPSVTATIYSDDNGRTWQRGEIAIPDKPPYRFPSETVVVQLADGRVMLNARSESDMHRRLVTTSADGATGWSRPRADEALLEPICMASIVRFDDKRIVFANPHNLDRRDKKIAPGKSRDRVNLSIKLSPDEGMSWPVNKPLEEGFSGYSDLAVTKDGTILCFYEAGQQRPYETLRLARFNLDWLTAGSAPVREEFAHWRDGVKVSLAAPQDGRHTIHSYFNTCPESPDGKWVLFFASKTPNAQRGDVVIRNRATGEEKTLACDIDTEDAHRVACQQWVSGGKRVVYHGQRDGKWLVAVVDVATGKERVLARDRLTGWSQPHADIVPLYGLHWDPKASRDLEMVNVETGEITTVVTAEAMKEKYPEFLAKLYGDKPVSIFFPILSPDLKRIFFKLSTPAGGDARSKQASNRLGMVVYSLNDKKFLRADNRWGHPAWHPDARIIIEAGNLLIDSKTGETKRIPVLPGFGSGHPSVSPDAKLFVTDTLMERLGGSSSEWGVVVTDIEGTHLTVINRSPSGGGAKSWRVSHPHPIFSADGRRIYFNANNGPWTQLCIAEKQ